MTGKDSSADLAIRANVVFQARRVTLVIPDLTAQGVLPLGRYSATLREIEESFVRAPRFAESVTRQEIWTHWNQAVIDLRRIVPVCAVWLAGSFLSDVMDPDDMDGLYIVPSREAFAAKVNDPSAAAVLGAFATNRVRAITGMRLDTFVLEWVRSPTPGAHRFLSGSYFETRGYWDDFWQRIRHGAKGTVNDSDCLPERGYLEVTFDGWSI